MSRRLGVCRLSYWYKSEYFQSFEKKLVPRVRLCSKRCPSDLLSRSNGAGFSLHGCWRRSGTRRTFITTLIENLKTLYILTKSASFSGSSCSAVQTSTGFSITSNFDECDFEATHENGVLTFSNTIVGQELENNFGLYLGGSTTSFTVSCKFLDQRNFWPISHALSSLGLVVKSLKVLLHHKSLLLLLLILMCTAK